MAFDLESIKNGFKYVSLEDEYIQPATRDYLREQLARPISDQYIRRWNQNFQDYVPVISPESGAVTINTRGGVYLGPGDPINRTNLKTVDNVLGRFTPGELSGVEGVQRYRPANTDTYGMYDTLNRKIYLSDSILH